MILIILNIGIINKENGRPIAPASGEKIIAMDNKNDEIKLKLKTTFLKLKISFFLSFPFFFDTI